jgi:hypothetical protein
MVIKHEKGSAVRGWEVTLELTPEEYVALLNLKSDLHHKEIRKIRRLKNSKPHGTTEKKT